MTNATRWKHIIIFTPRRENECQQYPIHPRQTVCAWVCQTSWIVYGEEYFYWVKNNFIMRTWYEKTAGVLLEDNNLPSQLSDNYSTQFFICHREITWRVLSDIGHATSHLITHSPSKVSRITRPYVVEFNAPSKKYTSLMIRCRCIRADLP